MGIVINSPALISWTTEPGLTYEIQYTTPAEITSADPWHTIGTVKATGSNMQFVDYGSEVIESRFYRIILKGVVL